MALSQRLEFRQTQALVMTPQLMQAIKLLQLSSLDLAAYVEGELESNPLLERADDDNAPAAAAEAHADPDASTGEGGQGDQGDQGDNDVQAAEDWIGADLETSRSAMEEGLGTELENVFPDDGAADGASKTASSETPPPAYSEWSGAGGGAGDDYNLEAFVSAEMTLSEHLSEQMALAILDPVNRMIGRYLIDMVDEAGYLSGDLAGVAEKLGAPLATVEAVLAELQTFDPSGVCARNLTECLSIQLRDRDRFDPAMQALVAHLDVLAKRDLAGLRRICGVNDEDLADMIAEIRNLNPKPGLAFGSTLVQPIVPDVMVRSAPDGSWRVELNSDTLPKVLINQRYYTQVSKGTHNDKDKSYLAECLQTATWLVRALDQRAKTILKVSSEIVRQQDAFFDKGVQYLRPLNLKTVADAISMHESTVSRVTANKYMTTPRGIFELKYFFTSSIASSDGGEAHSAEAVRHRIRQLIEAENAQEVLSDDTIVEKLNGIGIDIARRTVAKYREAMRIPSSVQRRRDKLAAG
jgi:RNA polymerase sigma-54 factor